MYQGQELKHFSETKSYFENHYNEFCQLVVENLRTRLQWSDRQLFRDVIFVLATQGWEKILQEDEEKYVIDIDEDNVVAGNEDDSNDDSTIVRFLRCFRQVGGSFLNTIGICWG